ncbi:hypothetical protein LWC34_50970 [Kibdelosporangium philippinense]|uniref:6-phosphogluconate dehydrogenase NADP-binding domain-containing protein n=1 Tax=Kibdelosporangium philippinense TaxID=211113 RepID=A0ABS8ZTL1_9PSEU|nr:NAD(P)-binding domain-containing protein [Kibdelosporangium philippinense]MCE7011075.1 hypothetical protein [Kibdelosporangium philippinense]
MAVNLIKAGHEVIGYSRSKREFGGRVANSIAAAVSDVEVTLTVLPDSPDVEAPLIRVSSKPSVSPPCTPLLTSSPT